MQHRPCLLAFSALALVIAPLAALRGQQPAANPPADLSALAGSGTGIRKPAKAIEPPIRSQDIQTFIRDLIAFLYASQNARGHWDEKESDPEGTDYAFAGTTSLAVYALLAAGESPQHPKLKPAIEWMKKAKVSGTYVVACRLNAYQYLPHNTVKTLAKADYDYLIKAHIPEKDPKTKQPLVGAGHYTYTDKDPNAFDHSNSQYGVLGMWACEQMGMPAPEGYWRAVEAGWLGHQHTDGSWSYSSAGGEGSGTGSMTAAGVATLFVTQDYLRGAVQTTPGQGNLTNEPIERGLKWLIDHFTPNHNPGERGSQHTFYWLYGIERVGLASGLKHFGKHDWFDAGARLLAASYYNAGKMSLDKTGDTGHLRDTCFALLFLARGSRPFLMNKLKYDGNWNERPRDAANVTKWYGQRIESELLWQIVSIDNDDREFHDAPILYLSGFGELNLAIQQKELVKRYVEDGGMLLANANGQSAEFVSSFKALCAELFPQFPIRPLPPEHPIQSGNVKLSRPVEIWGVSNGIRELCVLLPVLDPPRSWQSMRVKQDPEMFELASNVIAYATDKMRLRTRGETYFVTFNPGVKPERELKVARVKHAGNWNPEPGGWRRMAAILNNQNKVALTVSTATLGEQKLAGAKVAHLTGTGPLQLNDEQLKDLRSLLARGGTLLVDAAGGSPEFAKSMEEQLPKLFSDAKLEPLTLDDPVLADTRPLPEEYHNLFGVPPEQFNKDFKGYPLELEFRREAKARLKGKEGLQLKGIRLGRRWGVIICPVDLSAGLVGQSVQGVAGYTPPAATELVRRILVNTK